MLDLLCCLCSHIDHVRQVFLLLALWGGIIFFFVRRRREDEGERKKEDKDMLRQNGFRHIDRKKATVKSIFDTK